MSIVMGSEMCGLDRRSGPLRFFDGPVENGVAFLEAGYQMGVYEGKGVIQTYFEIEGIFTERVVLSDVRGERKRMKIL